MSVLKRAAASGLDGATTILLLLALVLAVLHHADHVLRVDHSGWPFREQVTPFTFSLLAYPVILFALFGARRLFALRLPLLALGTGFTVYAHTAIESPHMQFTMWADNRSLDRHGEDFHNIPGVQSPFMGVLAVAVGMALNVTAVAAAVSMLRRWLRLRRGGRISSGTIPDA